MNAQPDVTPMAQVTEGEATVGPPDEATIASSSEQNQLKVDDGIDISNQGTNDGSDARSDCAADADARPYVLDDLTVVPTNGAVSSETAYGTASSLRIEFGRTRVPPDDMRRWNEGTVVTLDNARDGPVDVYCADRLVAQGELVTLNDRMAVRLTHVPHGNEGSHISYSNASDAAKLEHLPTCD